MSEYFTFLLVVFIAIEVISGLIVLFAYRRHSNSPHQVKVSEKALLCAEAKVVARLVKNTGLNTIVSEHNLTKIQIKSITSQFVSAVRNCGVDMKMLGIDVSYIESLDQWQREDFVFGYLVAQREGLGYLRTPDALRGLLCKTNWSHHLWQWINTNIDNPWTATDEEINQRRRWQITCDHLKREASDQANKKARLLIKEQRHASRLYKQAQTSKERESVIHGFEKLSTPKTFEMAATSKHPPYYFPSEFLEFVTDEEIKVIPTSIRSRLLSKIRLNMGIGHKGNAWKEFMVYRVTPLLDNSDS